MQSARMCMSRHSPWPATDDSLPTPAGHPARLTTSLARLYALYCLLLPFAPPHSGSRMGGCLR